MAVIMRNAVFFHLPKTGGNWVRQALRNSTEVFAEISRHPTWRDFTTNGQFKFTFIRHPLTWFQSYWAYKMMRGWRDMDSDPIDEFQSADFNKFVSDVIKWYGGYVGFMYWRRMGPKIGFIGKQENLVNDLVEALNRAKQPFDEQALRETPPENVSDQIPEYDRNVAKAVILSEKSLLEKYDYSKDIDEVLK